jgi:PAS domain S-box-containing protein
MNSRGGQGRWLWEGRLREQPDQYFMIDAVGTVLSVNPFGSEQLGYTVAELLGRPALDVR